MSINEASSTETPYGRYITSGGWFVLNLADALAVRNHEKGGATFPLECQEARFPDVGVNVRILWPGDPNGLYHAENGQEDFLVVSGECTLLVEGQERTLRQWDFFHAPPMTHHIFVGAGDGPCAILMVGARREHETLHYPVSELAAKFGASATRETRDPGEAYADWPGDYQPVRLPWPVEPTSS